MARNLGAWKRFFANTVDDNKNDVHTQRDELEPDQHIRIHEHVYSQDYHPYKYFASLIFISQY